VKAARVRAPRRLLGRALRVAGRLLARPGVWCFLVAAPMLQGALPDRPSVTGDGAQILARARALESNWREGTEARAEVQAKALRESPLPAPLIGDAVALAWQSTDRLPTRRVATLHALLGALAIALLAGAAASATRSEARRDVDPIKANPPPPQLVALGTLALALGSPVLTAPLLSVGREVYLVAALALVARGAVALAHEHTTEAGLLGSLTVGAGLALGLLSHPALVVAMPAIGVLLLVWPRRLHDPRLWPEGGLTLRPVPMGLLFGLVAAAWAMTLVPAEGASSGPRRLIEATSFALRAPAPLFAWFGSVYRPETSATLPIVAPLVLLLAHAPAIVTLPGLLGLFRGLRAGDRSAWAPIGVAASVPLGVACLLRHPYATGVDLVAVCSAPLIPVAARLLVPLPAALAQMFGDSRGSTGLVLRLALATVVWLPAARALLVQAPAERVAASALFGGAPGLVRWGLALDPIVSVTSVERDWLADPELSGARPSVSILPQRDGRERILKELQAAGELPEGFYTGMPFSTARWVLRTTPHDDAADVIDATLGREPPLAEQVVDGQRVSAIWKVRD